MYAASATVAGIHRRKHSLNSLQAWIDGKTLSPRFCVIEIPQLNSKQKKTTIKMNSILCISIVSNLIYVIILYLSISLYKSTHILNLHFVAVVALRALVINYDWAEFPFSWWCSFLFFTFLLSLSLSPLFCLSFSSIGFSCTNIYFIHSFRFWSHRSQKKNKRSATPCRVRTTEQWECRLSLSYVFGVFLARSVVHLSQYRHTNIFSIPPKS